MGTGRFREKKKICLKNIDSGRYLRQWNMTVPLGYSDEQDPNVFFEAVRPKINTKLSSDLREFQRLKFMVTMRIK